MSTATVNIPSQVLNYANLAAFPVTGALKTIYIAEDSNLEYRWTGSAYQLLGAAGSGVQSVTGDGVNNTDPLNPVLTFPTPNEIGLGNVDNTSDANKPISTATQTALDGKVDENVAITGATKTKITYDAKGLVTSGADATTADITASTNKNYVTDAQLVVIGNTSNTNTGDETATRIATINHGTAAKTTLVDADELTGQDSASSFSLIRVTCLNVYNYLKSKFDSVYTTVSAVASQIVAARPVFRYYSDSATINPGDGGVFYSGTVNNYTVETGNGYRFISPKNNCIFHVTLNVFVRGTLASSETTTVKIKNVTDGTEETLNSVTHDKRINPSNSVSTIANTAGQEMIIQGTNPAWATNPTVVHYQFIIEGY